MEHWASGEEAGKSLPKGNQDRQRGPDHGGSLKPVSADPGVWTGAAELELTLSREPRPCPQPSFPSALSLLLGTCPHSLGLGHPTWDISLSPLPRPEIPPPPLHLTHNSGLHLGHISFTPSTCDTHPRCAWDTSLFLLLGHISTPAWDMAPLYMCRFSHLPRRTGHLPSITPSLSAWLEISHERPQQFLRTVPP